MAVPASTQELRAAQPIAREYFGMHVARAHDAQQWPRVAFGAWRLWDAGVTWAYLQPQPQVWRYIADSRGKDVALDPDAYR